MRSSTLSLATLLALGLAAPVAAQQGGPAAKPAKPAMTQQKPAPADSAKKGKKATKAMKGSTKHKMSKKAAKPDSTKKPA